MRQNSCFKKLSIIFRHIYLNLGIYVAMARRFGPLASAVLHALTACSAVAGVAVADAGEALTSHPNRHPGQTVGMRPVQVR